MADTLIYRGSQWITNTDPAYEFFGGQDTWRPGENAIFTTLFRQFNVRTPPPYTNPWVASGDNLFPILGLQSSNYAPQGSPTFLLFRTLDDILTVEPYVICDVNGCITIGSVLAGTHAADIPSVLNDYPWPNPLHNFTNDTVTTNDDYNGYDYGRDDNFTLQVAVPADLEPGTYYIACVFGHAESSSLYSGWDGMQYTLTSYTAGVTGKVFLAHPITVSSPAAKAKYIHPRHLQTDVLPSPAYLQWYDPDAAKPNKVVENGFTLSFGTDPGSLSEIGTFSPYQAGSRKGLGMWMIDFAHQLEYGMQYYWRVDSSAQGQDTPTTGDVWAFECEQKQGDGTTPTITPKPPDPDPPGPWDPGTHSFNPAKIAIGAAGYKQRIVLIGHKKVYVSQ